MEVTRHLNTNATSAWGFFSDFNGLDKWVPGITSSILEGDIANNIVGAKRLLNTADGKEIRETLVEYDTESRRLGYSIPGEDIPGVKGYTSVMSVNDKDDGGSEFTWSATFEVVKGYEDKVKASISDLFSSGADVIVKNFE